MDFKGLQRHFSVSSDTTEINLVISSLPIFLAQKNMMCFYISHTILYTIQNYGKYCKMKMFKSNNLIQYS